MSLQPDIAITFAALASSAGCSPEQLRLNLISENRGPSFTHRFSDRVNSPVGEIPWNDLGIYGLDPNDSDAYLLKGSQHVLDEVLRKSLMLEKYEAARTGLFLGTTTCGINGFFEAARKVNREGASFDAGLKPPMQQAALAKRLAYDFGIRGPVYTFSSSCAASAQAFVMAHDAIKMGWIDAAVVIGADVLNSVTVHGFDSLQLLDREFCKPFTEERAGINLSEAIVAMVLERDSGGTDGQFTKVRSFAGLSESHHMTQPAPEGEWMRVAMERAIVKGRIDPSSIDLINPHGTGTLANDAMEGLAIAKLFGGMDKIYSTKAVTGHALGASGLLELLILSIQLEDKASGAFQKVFGLKNSFGFGGVNMSIVLERGGF